MNVLDLPNIEYYSVIWVGYLLIAALLIMAADVANKHSHDNTETLSLVKQMVCWHLATLVILTFSRFDTPDAHYHLLVIADACIIHIAGLLGLFYLCGVKDEQLPRLRMLNWAATLSFTVLALPYLSDADTDLPRIQLTGLLMVLLMSMGVWPRLWAWQRLASHQRLSVIVAAAVLAAIGLRWRRLP